MKQFILGCLIFCVTLTSLASVKSVVRINYLGINCQYCNYRMQYKLNKLSNVEQVNVTPSQIRLIVPTVNQSDLLTIEKIIRDSGYIPGNLIIAETD